MADSSFNSALPDRAPAFRARPDLVLAADETSAPRWWTVKDPVTLKYFQLTAEEYAVLTWLDGRLPAVEICRRFNERFAPRELTLRSLQYFLARLNEQGLLLADAPGYGEDLLAKQVRRKRLARWTAPLRWLALRWRGFDPQPLLVALTPLAKALFSRTAAVLAALLCGSALLLIATQFEEFRRRLPEAAAFFGGANAPGLIAAFVALKICHELGHALACRRFGGECHELGVWLVAGVPCLYCNVSDAWLWPQRARRIIVGAAGMYVELLIASACVFLWWASEPGWLHATALNLIFVASVGTLLVNGNPLLRYDGYYILADLVAQPNLWQQSQAVLRHILARWLFGWQPLAQQTEHALSRRRAFWLGVYGVAAVAYRALVVAGLLALVYHVLDEYRLAAVAQILILLTLVGLCLAPAIGLWRLWNNPLARERFRRRRTLAFAATAALLLCAICFTPLPYRVRAWAVLEPADAERMYVTVPGTLRFAAPPGQHVAAGSRLAMLENPELELEIARLASERDRQRLLVDSLRARRKMEQLPAAIAALADLEAQLARREEDRAELELKAPVAGVVLPPPAVAHRAAPAGELRAWQGTPLDERNQGAYLTTGTLVCLVGAPERLEAILSVPQEEIELVAPGQRVRLKLDELPAEILQGEVLEVAKLDLKLAPRELTAAGRLAAREDASGAVRPLQTWYQARVRFESPQAALLLRSGGKAKILVPPRSLAWRFWRFVERTFRVGRAA